VVAQLASQLSEEDAHRLAEVLYERLRDLQRPLSAALIKTHISSLGALYSAHPTYRPWEAQLLQDGERILEAMVLHSQSDSGADMEEKEPLVVRCLFTVGEIALVGATRSRPHPFHLISPACSPRFPLWMCLCCSVAL
jgi:hypothetical protein